MPRKFKEIFALLLREEGVSEADIERRARMLVEVAPGLQATFDEVIADDRFEEVLKLNRELKDKAVKDFHENPVETLDKGVKGLERITRGN